MQIYIIEFKICFSEPTAGEEVFAPRFVEKLQPKHVPDGATVQFECQVEGNPHPQITWFRQTAIIKPSQDFQVGLIIVCCVPINVLILI